MLRRLWILFYFSEKCWAFSFSRKLIWLDSKFSWVATQMLVQPFFCSWSACGTAKDCMVLGWPGDGRFIHRTWSSPIWSLSAAAPFFQGCGCPRLFPLIPQAGTAWVLYASLSYPPWYQLWSTLKVKVVILPTSVMPSKFWLPFVMCRLLPLVSSR